MSAAISPATASEASVLLGKTVSGTCSNRLDAAVGWKVILGAFTGQLCLIEAGLDDIRVGYVKKWQK